MNHTPTCTAAVYTCERCTFRAVLTTRGVFVLDPGDGKQAHLDAITMDRAQRREWVYAVVTRLRGPEVTQRPIFWELYRLAREAGREVSIAHFPCTLDNGVLTPRQRERLVRAVMMEYGND